jgi:hypothetical protein
MTRFYFVRTFFTFMVFCSGISSHAATYNFALRHLPTTLSPTENQRFAGALILWQMVWPMFFYDENRILQSKILTDKGGKAIDSTFKKFQFCFRSNLKFGSGRTAVVEDYLYLFQRLKTSVVGFEEISEVKKLNENCVAVSLQNRDLGFFDKLTGIASGLYNFDSNHPLALDAVGPYVLKESSDERFKLNLSLNINHSVTFNSIAVVKYNPEMNWVNYDLNFVTGTVQSPILKDGLINVKPPLKKVYAIVVNLKSQDRRRCFVSAIDTSKISSILKLETIATTGFLPSEVLGSDVPFIKPAFDHVKCANYSYIWSEFRTEDIDELNEYLKVVSRATGLKVSVRKTALESLIQLSESGREYIAVVGFSSEGSRDSWNVDSTPFFDSFKRKNGVISGRLQEFTSVIDNAARAGTLAEKTKLLRLGHDQLLKSWFVLPIGEVQKKFYYKRNIRNIVWGDKVSAIPLVSEM